MQSPIINRLRQDLAWQFPEVAHVKSRRGVDSDVPLLWGWLCGAALGAQLDGEKAAGRPVRLVRSRISARAAKLLFRELVKILE